MCCVNFREEIFLCVLGILGNRLCCVKWELSGTDSVVCCGNCMEEIMLCVVGIVGNK